MKRFVCVFVCLAAALAAYGVVARAYQQVLPPPTASSPGTLEVSEKVALTSNSEYDRNPSVCYDGAGVYWLFYTKGDNTSTSGVRGTSYDPDSDTYVVYYKYASTIAGLVTAAEEKLANSESTRPAGFDQRVVTAAMIGNDIYAIVSSGQSGTDKQMYYYKRTLYPTAGAWSTATLLTSDTGGHVNAVSDGSTIYIVWESSDGSSDAYTFDGTTLTAKVDISTDNQPKITRMGTTLYVVSIEDGTGDIEVRSSATSPMAWSWHSTAIPGAGFYDPCIFNDGTDLYVVSAPYLSGTDQQYLMQAKYDSASSSWAAAKRVSLGGYGTTFWWDYWPVGYNDSGDLWLFFTTETSSLAYSDGEIAAVKMDWDLANDHCFYVQNAVNQAIAGDTINVAAGTYTENVTVNKALTLLGAQAGVDARGRSADESVLTAASGNVLYVKTAGITVDGFQLTGAGASEVVFADTCGSLQFENNILDGTAVSLLYFGTTSPDVTISRNEFDGASVSADLLFFDGGSDAYNNLTIHENNFAAGQIFAGGKTYNSSNMLMAGNLFDGAYLNLSSHFADSTIRGNTFRNNTYTNAQVGLKDSCICDNVFETAGPSPYAGYPSYTLMLWGNQYGLLPSQNVTVEGNTFCYNGTAAPGELAHGVRILAGIDATTLSFAYNAFRDEGLQAGASGIVNQGTGTLLAENNWWGSLESGIISGMVSGLADVDPYLWTSQIHVAWSGARLVERQLADGGWAWWFDGTSSSSGIIGPTGMGLAQAYRATGDSAMYNALVNATLPKKDVSDFLLAKTNNFSNQDGYLAAELDDILGVTTHVDHLNTNFYGPLAAGTYNRNGLGTLYSTMTYIQYIRDLRAGQGLPNLAAWDLGMALTAAASCGVSGTELEFWIDGVKAEINEMGDLMTDDCEVIGLAGALYGLAYVGEAFDPSGGIFASCDSLADLANALASYQIPSSGGFTSDLDQVTPGNEALQETAYAVLALNEVGGHYTDVAEAAAYVEGVQLCTGGWRGYVTSKENNEVTAEGTWGLSKGNRLELNLPTASLYVKPGENVVIDMDVSNLLQLVNGCQAILNFSSTCFETEDPGDVTVVEGSASSSSVWDQVIWNVWDSGGDLDTAVGVNAQGAVGTDDDATVCKITLKARTGVAGTTQIVFRADVDDLECTWLSDMSAQAVSPNRVDSQMIVIDGTAPSLNIASAKQSGTELLISLGSTTNAIQGTIAIQVTASDALAGLDGVPAVTVTPNGGSAETATFVNESPAGTFNYTWSVTSTTPNGVATIDASVSDLSGNEATDSDTFDINKNQIAGDIELEGFVGTSRDVVFVSTGTGESKTWTITVDDFGGGATGTFALTDVPDGTTNLSAKTAWHLRRKVAAVLDINGQATADLTGDDKLLGGDLNGTNSINILDYSVLKTNWYTHMDVADINGDGSVSTSDYSIINTNWFKRGDEE